MTPGPREKWSGANGEMRMMWSRWRPKRRRPTSGMKVMKEMSRNRSEVGADQLTVGAGVSHPAWLKAASHDSQMLVMATYSQQMTEVISSTSLTEDGACRIFAGENRQLKFHRTSYPITTISKNRNVFFVIIIIIIVLGKILEQFCIGTDMLSADRLHQHRMTEKL